MPDRDSHVTIHMASSLDGFIARKDGRVDCLETSDEFPDGDTIDQQFGEAFLKTIVRTHSHLRTLDDGALQFRPP